MTTNISTGTITDILLRPARSWRHDLAEIGSLILGVQNDNAEYWEEELDNGRVYIEVNPYDGDEWDAALSVFVVGEFIGDILLHGDIDVKTDSGALGATVFVLGDFINRTEA